MCFNFAAYGLMATDGDCIGHDLTMMYGTVDYCYTVCMETTGCKGFVFFHSGAEQDTCYFKDDVCTELDMVYDPDAVYYEMQG